MRGFCFTVVFAAALLLCQLGLQLSLVGSQTAVHLLLLLQLLAELRHTSAQLSTPERARTDELNTDFCDAALKSNSITGCVAYFFSKLCFSLLISETRCSRLSQRSSVSLNLDFMLFTWQDKVSRTTH